MNQNQIPNWVVGIIFILSIVLNCYLYFGNKSKPINSSNFDSLQHIADLRYLAIERMIAEKNKSTLELNEKPAQTNKLIKKNEKEHAFIDSLTLSASDSLWIRNERYYQDNRERFNINRFLR